MEFLRQTCNIILKSSLRQGLSEPESYGDIVYKLKKIFGSNNFSAQFIKIFSHYKKIGYYINEALQGFLWILAHYFKNWKWCERKVSGIRFIQASRGVFFTVHHFCCILQQVCICWCQY